MTELFCKGTTWVSYSIAKELCMFQFSTFLLNIVKGILERNLLVWMRSLVLWNYGLLRFEVEKIQRIRQLCEELLDTVFIDVSLIAKGTLQLQLLGVGELFLTHILQCQTSFIHVLKCFLETHSVKVEDGWMWNDIT